TSDKPSANTTVATGNSGGPLTVSVPYNSRTFFLYNNQQELASRTATSSCVAGTTWNGSSCAAAPTTGTLTLSSSSCTIAAAASSCSASLPWTTTPHTAPSRSTSDKPSANTTVATGNSGGPLTVSVPYNSRTFF